MTRRSRMSRISGLATAVALLAGTALAGAAPPAAAAPSGSGGAVLTPDDSRALTAAQARGDARVTLLMATEPGATEGAAAAVRAAGGTVGRTEDGLGYLRASVPTAKVETLVAHAPAQAVTLNKVVDVPDTTAAPDGGTASAAADSAAALPVPGYPYLAEDPRAARRTAEAKKDLAKRKKAAAASPSAAGLYPAPNAKTPAANPYLPVKDIGATDFVKAHPRYDGRGVTIGILDTGVDVDNPVLATTSTGERKITGWSAATDPLLDGDGSWLPMLTSVSGPSFSYGGTEYTAPEGDYTVALFKESATAVTETGGDMNRDGDTDDSWAVLYDRAGGGIRVDTDGDHDFTNNPAMLPYQAGHQVGHFGTDDPKTGVAEDIPFTVEARKDVDLSPVGGPYVGKKADFVNIGFAEGAHATHVAGIAAGNKLFGGKMTGAAPGARIVSARACWGEGCTYSALTEGLIDLVAHRGVDVVNISIGGLPALNDASDARAVLYQRLIDTYGVQLVISAGNEGPGMNTVGEPGDGDGVLGVAASVTRETWAADYGSQVAAREALFPFSSRGPREDGGFQPNIAAPGAAVSSVPTWQPGQPVAEAGYQLPAGYGMMNGTSMAAPETTGGAALLLSAAKATRTDASPAKLRTAVLSTARALGGYQRYEQGSGVLDVPAAWRLLSRGRAVAEDGGWTVSAPVKTELSGYLQTPDRGAGLYDRGRPGDGGPKAGVRKSYQVTITRTTGRPGAVDYRLGWQGNDGTFAAPSHIRLTRGKAAVFTVAGRPAASGAHSAILTVDDPATGGTDHRMLATVVAGDDAGTGGYAVAKSGSVDRNQTRSWMVDVPQGATALELSLTGTGGGRSAVFASDPYGLPTVDIDYNRAKTISIPNPTPGVWNIGATASRASALLSNPYTVAATVYGTSFSPNPAHIASAKAGEAAPVEWTASNAFAPVAGASWQGSVGSQRALRPTIADGERQSYTVAVPAGATQAVFSTGRTADAKADLDLSVYDASGAMVGQSAGSTADEKVTLANPAAGTYTVYVDAYSVPSGSTAYDYADTYLAPSLGTLSAAAGAPTSLATGASAKVAATLTPASAPADGRSLVGTLALRTASGTTAGTASVTVDSITR
ncbi:hypothetical protein BIV57_16205 [Mangrovactinospora gilvigrisea]|uniref:Serine protease n=1 Tax=Mangrovactinospora gilvigrisea TaxID=1428644 RepID=A0A1J7C4H5_9ACTN|nr:S8 family serine peptidase [Mangrovactinospora gilvigrisea]OIV36464.1 hypothetical protein BIV57_16205 [Mangrovactinospora gilvigrisea]